MPSSPCTGTNPPENRIVIISHDITYLERESWGIDELLDD
jgi:hypothetical protein